MEVAGLVLAIVPLVSAMTVALNKAWERIQLNSDAVRDLRNHCTKLLEAVHSSIPAPDKLNRFFLEDLKVILTQAIDALQMGGQPRIRHVAHNSLERQFRATGEAFTLESILRSALQEAISGSVSPERIQEALIQALSISTPSDETRGCFMSFLKRYMTFTCDLFRVLDALNKLKNEAGVLSDLNLGRKLSEFKQRMDESKLYYDTASAYSFSWDALLQKRSRTYVKKLSQSEEDVKISQVVFEESDTLAYIRFCMYRPLDSIAAGLSPIINGHFCTRSEGVHSHTPQGRQWRLWHDYQSLADIRNRLQLDSGVLTLYLAESDCLQPFIVLVRASDYEYGCCPAKGPAGLNIMIKDILPSLPLVPAAPVKFVCLLTGSELPEDTSCADIVLGCTPMASSALCIAYS